MRHLLSMQCVLRRLGENADGRAEEKRLGAKADAFWAEKAKARAVARIRSRALVSR